MTAMSCHEAEPLLPLVADGSVGPDSDPALFAHLASCPTCQRAVAEHDLIALALERGAANAPAAPRRASLRFWIPLAAAACLAIATVVTLHVLRTTTEHSPSVGPGQLVVTPAPSTPAKSDTPDVIRIVRSDGSTQYLVRRNGEWQLLDPSALDGAATQNHATGEGVPVKY